MCNDLILNPEILRKVNSATKYPSILTYHNLGNKGNVIEGLTEGRSFPNDSLLYVTEKIDGTNSRAVMFTDDKGQVIDYMIGSREDILFAMNDRIINPSQGIVDQMKPCVEKIIQNICNCFGFHEHLPYDSIICLYGETYGGKINGAKQYTGHGNSGIRFFDYWTMDMDEFRKLLELPLEKISSWREHGGQPFVSVSELKGFCMNAKLETVPYIYTTVVDLFPNDLQTVWNWLQAFSRTRASLDDDGKNHSEGVVVRTEDRSMIRKIRFEDYEKAKRMGLIC